MSETIVLLMSKYSDNCNRLKEIMKSSGMNFHFIETLFIDNTKIRQCVVNMKEYNITKVPTIMVFGSDQVQKFDGIRVFQWMKQTINNLRQNEQDDENEREIEIHNQVEQKVQEQMEILREELQEQSFRMLEQEQEQEQQFHNAESPKTDINSLLGNNMNFGPENSDAIDMEAADKIVEKSLKKNNSIAEKIKKMEDERNMEDGEYDRLLKSHPK